MQSMPNFNKHTEMPTIEVVDQRFHRQQQFDPRDSRSNYYQDVRSHNLHMSDLNTPFVDHRQSQQTGHYQDN